MKRFLSISLIIGILLSTLSIIGVSVYAKQESDELQAFIDDTIELINQSHDFSNKYSRIKIAEETETDSGFEACRLIVKSNKKPDELNSIGMASGFEDYYIIQFSNQYDTEVAFDYYSEQESVVSVYPDEIVSLSDFESISTTIKETKAAPERLDSWGADAVGLYDLKNYILNNKISVHETVVAVVDSGVDLEHEFFKGRLIETNFNSSGEGNENDESDTKGHGHGTMVTSVIVDSTPDNVKVANYKVSTDGATAYITTIVTGILKAVSDEVDVINASFAAPGTNDMIMDATKMAFDSGVIVVTAAGNSSEGLMHGSSKTPASSPYAITAASCDQYLRPSNWSGRGACVDVSAPGEDVAVATVGNSYRYASGTSFSAPMVASACAVAVSLNKNITPQDMLEKVKETATPFAEHLGFIKLYGCGILDAVELSGLERNINIESNYKPGKYEGEIGIELKTELGCEIYYTTDCTVPTKSNGILYTNPIILYGSTSLIRAVAYDEQGVPSEMFSGLYRSAVTGDESDFVINEDGVILSYCGDIKELIIPNSINGITVTDIADDAFVDCELSGVTLPDSIVTLTGGFIENETILFIDGINLKEIGYGVFEDMKLLTSINFPNLEKIDGRAFAGITSLRQVILPKVKYLGDSCFEGSRIDYFYLPELEVCEEMAFSDCTNIYELYAPKLKKVLAVASMFSDGYLFDGASVYKPLDLPSMEDLPGHNFRGFNNRGYIERVEFSNLKKLEQLPNEPSPNHSETIKSKTFYLVLPNTLETITIKKEDAKQDVFVIYGSRGTLVEQWANENGFKFIEITPETGVITDLPEYYKSYMGELEADVVGFNRQYQWFANTVNSNEGGKPIEGATNKTFNPSDYPAQYYYCVVTSTDKGFDPVVIKTSACENRAAVADYSKVNEAIAKVPTDLSKYTLESRLNLENAVSAVEWNLSISNQSQVDAMASAIENAIDSLKTVTIKLSESHIELKKNEKHTITAESESKVQWSSDNPDVAIVDEEGVVTAVGKGTALITATTETGVVASCNVEVNLTLCQWIVYILKCIITFLRNCICLFN